MTTKKGCKPGFNDSESTPPNPDESGCKSKLKEFFAGVTECVTLLGYTLEYLDDNGRIITYDEVQGLSPKKVPYRKHPVHDLDKAMEIKAKITIIYNECKDHVEKYEKEDMKYMGRPLLIARSAFALQTLQRNPSQHR